MRNIIRLSLHYIRHYKKQAVTILFSIILSMALVTGISSLLYSKEQSSLEKAREQYGSWHFLLPMTPEAEPLVKNPRGRGYEAVSYTHLEGLISAYPVKNRQVHFRMV